MWARDYDGGVLTRSQRTYAEAVLLLVLLPAALLAGVDTAWVRRYDGPAHLGDNATCVAVDSQGNVVVTGVSVGADSTPDWVTIKYGSAGESLWADRRSFVGNGKPLGLGVDAEGNVYVTGYQNTQAVTVKYGPTGQLLWESRLAEDVPILVGIQE